MAGTNFTKKTPPQPLFTISLADLSFFSLACVFLDGGKADFLRMKIQCNVCESAEARVLCCADEAALCWSCDDKVHAANKLASKHQRVPLSASSSPMPKCDICQVKLTFIYLLLVSILSLLSLYSLRCLFDVFPRVYSCCICCLFFVLPASIIRSKEKT